MNPASRLSFDAGPHNCEDREREFLAVCAFEDAWRRGDLEEVLQLLAPDLELTSTTPFGVREPVRGQQAHGERINYDGRSAQCGSCAVVGTASADASPDLLPQMIVSLANAMMSAQADQVCGAGYGERSDERVNRRNGYRSREWDTRVGTVELAIPKLREGSYFPDWLLTHRRRAEQALVTVVATAYLLGVSTRRVERLAEQLGVKSLSRSQVSEMAAHLDAQVSAFRDRPLDTGPYTFVWADALRVKVREDGRVVNVHALIATGVNADGHREILGLDVASAEDGAGWPRCGAAWLPAACLACS